MDLITLLWSRRSGVTELNFASQCNQDDTRMLLVVVMWLLAVITDMTTFTSYTRRWAPISSNHSGACTA